jgi:hypothetical protein
MKSDTLAQLLASLGDDQNFDAERLAQGRLAACNGAHQPLYAATIVAAHAELAGTTTKINAPLITDAPPNPKTKAHWAAARTARRDATPPETATLPSFSCPLSHARCEIPLR